MLGRLSWLATGGRVRGHSDRDACLPIALLLVVGERLRPDGHRRARLLRLVGEGAPRGAGRSCRRSAAWRSEREGSVRAQRRRARGGRGRAARVEVGVETARAQRTGDGVVELPGTTAPAPVSRGCRCTQSPRRRCRPERVTSPRAGEERARRGRGVASPCRTSRTSCHERRPSSRRRLTLRLILTGRKFFQS